MSFNAEKNNEVIERYIPFFLFGLLALGGTSWILHKPPHAEEDLFFITVSSFLGLLLLTLSIRINTGNVFIEKYLDGFIGMLISCASYVIYHEVRDITVTGESALHMMAFLSASLMLFFTVGAVIILWKIVIPIKRSFDHAT